MGKINKQQIETLLSFLGENNDRFFLIGGHAVAIHLEKIGLTFRATKDFDIVLITKIDDSSFSKQLEKMLINGEYKNKYRNDKKTAYRFESPVSNAYPKIIEFFVEEGQFPESLDRRLAKLDIEVNEGMISAIVLDKEVFEFAKRHVVIVDRLPVVDINGLIALKTLAYFKNKDLHEQSFVDENDYQKHRKDIIRLISIVQNKEPIYDLPESLLKPVNDFIKVLKESESAAKEYRVNLKDLIEIYKTIFTIKE